ncbi:MAG: hypothetical protein LBJ61_10335 [Deltaproteobacteria bacterium]|jgi:hypothetical protein|nr:hypothetical protein [Deltaproteobacteria bacterium]
MMADRFGYDIPEYPQEITVKPSQGKQRRFSVEYWAYPDCKILTADEIGPSHYHCLVVGAMDRPFTEMWDELIRRLKKQISVKYVKKDGNLGKDQKAVGYLRYNKERDDLDYVVDGFPYPWYEFIAQHIDNYEGWQMKIEFIDSSDEVE